MPRVMLEKPDRLRVQAQARPVGVDRAAKVIRGWIVAQEGPFKSEDRGEFDGTSLAQIVEKWPKAGLKSRFSHPTESSDGLGKGVGWKHKPYLSTVSVDRDGKSVQLQCVRCDFHLSPSAFETNPNGNLGEWLLDTAEKDPAMLSSSLVLSKDTEYRLNKDGTPQRDAAGERELPPLWRVKKLFASDVVDDGDAVDGAMAPLSAEPHWTRDYLTTGAEIIDKLFAGQPRRVVKARLTSFLNRYLDRRYGDSEMTDEKLGASLAGVLNGYIDEAAGGDENARAGVIANMATDSGLSTDDVIAILNGDDAGVTTPILESFSRVLECPLSELVAAAEADGIDLTGAESEEPSTEEPPADVPPDAPPAMGAKPGVLRRRLELKTKAG